MNNNNFSLDKHINNDQSNSDVFDVTLAQHERLGEK